MDTGISYGYLIFLVCGIVHGTFASEDVAYKIQFDSKKSLDSKLEKGKSEMDALIKRSKLPHVGDCWKDAIADLRASCGYLDDEMQSRLALAFTTCFVEMTGSPTHICDKSTPIKNCLSSLDNYERDTFRDYFLHTQDMCYYIQSEMWQEETDRVVNDLQTAAIEMGKTVQEQKTIADSILESQHNTHNVQREILKENYEVFEKVITMKTSLDEFGEHAKEHRALFGEIFEKLSRMQELVIWIQGEMSLIDLASFYAVSVIFCYFITTTERGKNARVWMMITIVLGLFVERYLYGYLTESGDRRQDEVLQLIYHYRKIVGATAVIIFLFNLARYRDYDVINNSILTDMKHQVDCLVDICQEQRKELAARHPFALPSGVRRRKFKQILDSKHRTNDAIHALENGNVPPPLVEPSEAEESDVEKEDKGDIELEGHNSDSSIDAMDLPSGKDSDNSDFLNSDNEPELETPAPTALQKLTKFIGNPMQKTMPILANPSGAIILNQNFGEAKYNLRDRKLLNSPIKNSVDEPKPKRGQKVKPKRTTTGYYSSDDDL